MSVYTWGLGKSGQLGVGSVDTQHTPKQPKLPMCTFLHSGGLYTAAVTEKGRLYTFGFFTKTGVSCGLWHGTALTNDGNVYIWGYDKAVGFQKTSEIDLTKPSLLEGPFCNKVRGVSCGNNFTLLWTTEGVAYSWGNGNHGVLGNGTIDNQMSPARIKLSEDEKVVYMNAGFAHCGAVTESGNAFMFGKGEDGALGLSEQTIKVVATPTKVPGLDEVSFVELSCSVGEHHGHTLFVTSDGRVFSVGDGYKGKLGLGDQISQRKLTQIPQENFQGECIAHVSTGGIHSAAVSKEGHVFTWGCGSDGRLGHPEAKGHRYLYRCDVPRIVDSLISAGKALTVSCSYYHSVALIEKYSSKSTDTRVDEHTQAM